MKTDNGDNGTFTLAAKVMVVSIQMLREKVNHVVHLEVGGIGAVHIARLMCLLLGFLHFSW